MVLIKKYLRVASVIDEYRIVLNFGSADGAEVGMKFLVYALGDEIIDPASDEALGELEIVRGKVVITHLQDRMSTAEAIKTQKRDTVRTKKEMSNIFRSPLLEPTTEIREEIVEEQNPLHGPEIGDYIRRLS